jgi:hypothetical protein
MSQGFTRGVPIDTDPTLSLDSDLVVPSQKAIKDYVDTGLNTKQDTITLTTTGSSGPATLTGATLNIPQYSGGGGSRVVFKSTTPGTPSTPTVETVIDSVFIPANTFTVGDIVRMENYCIKNFTGFNWSWRIYNNTSNTLTGANNIGRGNTNNPSFRYISWLRTFFIESPTVSRSMRIETLTGYYTDSGAPTVIANSNNIDWTVDQYILFTAVTSGSETITSSGYIIDKY